MPPGRQPTTCVIGAGISGLTAGKASQDWGLPYTCFEASDDIGGNWYFGNPNGRSSAYPSLHIDTVARQRLLPRHADGRGLPGLPAPRADPRLPEPLRRGLRAARPDPLQDAGRAGRAQARRRLARSPSRTASTEEFDFLVVGNGHHWDPRFPDFPGSFDGETIHSHHYIDPTEPLDLHGKRVLVVGIGNSAVDIVSELSRKGVAEKVFLSTRSGAWVMPKYIFGRPIGHARQDESRTCR